MKTAPADPRRAWSFLAMAQAELSMPVRTMVIAAVVLAAPLLFLAGFPRPLLALPAAVLAGAAFWGWLVSTRNRRAIEDIALSRIASTAQGYARLEGRAAAFPGAPLRSLYSGEPCCWYSYRMVTRNDQGEVEESFEETTDWSFALKDSSGECIVDPAGAKVVSVRLRRHHEQTQTMIEKSILAGDPLFVIGEFTTSGAHYGDHDIHFRVGQLIAEWKKDMPALIRRFDVNRDGRFSEQEWDLLRREARSEVLSEFARNPPQPQNLIARPRDGRAFLVSAVPSEQLVRDLQIWTAVHLAGFAAGIVAIVWALRPGAG